MHKSMAKVSFNNKQQLFYTSLKSAVDKYFENTGKRKRKYSFIYQNCYPDCCCFCILYADVIRAGAAVTEGCIQHVIGLCAALVSDSM